MSPSELLDLIIDRAPRLRAAGVRHLSMPEISFTLADEEPAVVTAADVVRALGDEEPADPLDDPATFGRKSGTPGFDFSDTTDDDS